MCNLRQTYILSALAVACHAASAQSVFAPTIGEYNWSTTVNQLGMRGVHSRGILGQGVIVGILDTGINSAHPEFSNNSRVLAGFNAVDGSSDVSDAMGHGTHVSGIIGAPGNGTGMYGVAPAANLLMVKVFNGSTASSSAINRGLDYAVSRGARVVNMSLGANSPTGDASLRQAASGNNTVIVVAAGNESARNPSWPARYAKEGWANGTIVAVGAVDANKRLASFSNRAGDTAAFFLVAPGVNIISSYSTGYAYMTGTSMATPAVSGAAALVSGYWPYLRANQVAAILLNTADDLGAPGVDAVYGRGMLNVNRALSPIGRYTYRIATGDRVVVSLSGQRVLSSQPHVTTPSAFEGLRTDVFDEYGRNFTSDEGSTISMRSVMTVDSILGRADRLLDAANQVLGNGARLMRLQPRQTHTPQADPWNHIKQSDASMVSLQLASGDVVSAGDGGLAGMSLGLMGSRMATRLSGAEGLLGNALLGFAPKHQFATWATPIGHSWTGRVGVARAHADNSAAGDVNVMELTYEDSVKAINISAAQLTEQGMLGGYSQQHLGLNQQTGSTGVTVSGAWALATHWTLAGAYGITQTSAPAANGMLLGGTSVQSQSYGLGLIRSDNWRDDDRLSMTLNAPLRAKAGSLSYSVVTGVNEQGEPVYGTHLVNLASGAQEWIAETRYATRLTSGATLSVAAAWRINPDNESKAPSQLALGARYNLSF